MRTNAQPDIITFEHSHLELLTICKQNRESAKLPRALHRHNDCLELVLVNKGSGTYNIDGKHYSTSDGDMLIYNSGVLHDEHHIIDGYDHDIEIFGCSIVGLKMPGLPLNHLIPNNVCPKISTQDYHHSISSLFSLLHSHSNGIKQFNREIVNHILKALLILVTEIAQKNLLSNKQKENQIGFEIQCYLDEHYWDDINLAHLANALEISPFYLSHAFKKYSGYSPLQYVARRRIGEAQTLLIHSKYNLTQIAQSVGFSNVTYFQSVFVKYVGITPKEYRDTMLDEKRRGYVLVDPLLLRAKTRI